MATNTVGTTFYIIAKPTSYNRSGKPITGIKVTDVRQSKPAVPRGSIVIGIRLTVPVEVLEDWVPIIDVDVAGNQITPPVMEAILSGLAPKGK